jgi:hypothetical protein
MEVERVEVKRSFVASERAKTQLQNMTGTAFETGFMKIKDEICKLLESDLNKLITRNWPTRLNDYNRLAWYFEDCSIDDLGVWYGAGGLPEEWCIGSVRETARCLLEGRKELAHLKFSALDKRALNNLPSIMNVADVIAKIPLLAPIALPAGTRRPTPPCRLMKGDIDDGSMRAIAFALKKIETFKAYVSRNE